MRRRVRATGYVAFLALTLYLDRPGCSCRREAHRAVSEKRLSRPYRESTRARRAGPRPGPRFGASDRRSTAPAASNCSVIRRVSSCHFVLERASPVPPSAPRFSLARRMSSLSFMLRPTPRAAVVARPSDADADGLAAEERPENRRAHRQPGLQLLLRRLRRTRARSDACGAPASAPRSASAWSRTSCAASSTAASRATRCASRTRAWKSRSLSPGFEVSFEIALAHELELLGLRQPAAEVLVPRRRSSSPGARPPALRHRSRPPDPPCRGARAVATVQQ